MIIKTALFSFLIPCFLLAQNNSLESGKQILKIMGTRFEVTAVAENKNLAIEAVEKGIEEMNRIERLISSWDSDSQTSEINRNAGVSPVKVSNELYDLISRARSISAITDGAFDISFAAVHKLYTFDGQERMMPDSLLLKPLLAKINWKNIIMNPDDKSVFLINKGMRIGFGAIGKGYAANRAKHVMSSIEGVHGGVVNASGDLIVWGEKSVDSKWKVQITDPSDQTKILAWLELENTAIVTSGNYEKFFTSNGERYAHIINPKTGIPTTGIKSVSIVCPDTELADALATSVFVLGPIDGLDLINRIRHVEGLIITDSDEFLTTDNLLLNKYLSYDEQN